MITINFGEGKTFEVVKGAWVFYEDRGMGVNRLIEWDDLAPEQIMTITSFTDSISASLPVEGLV